jgi:DNA polymerase III subunit gamma/tau
MWDVVYRPLLFSDVLGQEGTIQVLKSRLRKGTALNTSYIFSGGHGRGKCVRGNTLVPTDKGLVPIESLMGPHQIDPSGVRVLQEQGVSTAAYSYRGGLRQTLRIRTHLGFELEGTPDHRIRVLSNEGTIEWRPLEGLHVGDFACIVRRGQFGRGARIEGFRYDRSDHDHSSLHFSVPLELTPEWGSLMGYMVGDGSCRHRTEVSVSCAELDVRPKILKLLRKLGGEGHETPDKRRPGLTAVRCSRVQFRSFLAHLGVGYVGAAHKVVPWSILASPEPVVAAFLQAYFECDGSVGGQRIEAVSKSPELARQLQVLLLQFGIVARRSKKHHPKYGTFWRLIVKGTSVPDFASRIGFVSDRKQLALEALVRKDHARGRRLLSNTFDVVPYQALAVKAFYEGLPKGSRNRDTSHYFRCRRGAIACTSRQVERAAVEFADTQDAGHFVRLYNAGYVYDPVVEICAGACEVFDLNVPDGEMFSANGFMNHNTTLARILARGLLCLDLREDGEPCNECDNCRAVLDETSAAFFELDAASRGTIDVVRKIVDDLDFVVHGASKRVYLFDEVHRMSRESQDVLLKPLEDKRLVGIFCTTEPAKIRGTIRSRCEEYPVFKISREDVLRRMQRILQKEGVEYEDDAILTVIDHSGGHVRDVINRMEMIAQLGKVDLVTVREYLNLSLVSTYYEILLALGDPPKAVALIEEACDRVSPDDVSAGLAEAAMNAYRLAHGFFAEFVYVDQELAAKVHGLYGDRVVGLAEYFLHAPRATKVGLICDIIRCAGGVPTTARPAQSAAPPIVVQLAPPPRG